MSVIRIQSIFCSFALFISALSFLFRVYLVLVAVFLGVGIPGASVHVETPSHGSVLSILARAALISLIMHAHLTGGGLPSIMNCSHTGVPCVMKCEVGSLMQPALHVHSLRCSDWPRV